MIPRVTHTHIAASFLLQTSQKAVYTCFALAPRRWAPRFGTEAHVSDFADLGCVAEFRGLFLGFDGGVLMVQTEVLGMVHWEK